MKTQWFMLLALCALMIFASPTPSVAQERTAPSPAESVNEETLFKQENKIQGRITIPDTRLQTLIQPQGRDWRAFHERLLPWIGGILIVAMTLGLLLFFVIVGPTRVVERATGRKIIRYKAVERFSHWMVASSFIILGLSGLNYIYGKRLLEPLMGADAFGALSQWLKYAHNFFAWPFTFGILMLFLFWARDNVPNHIDWQWLRQGGGLVGNTHVHAGRFNAGQKLMFWSVIIGSLLMFGSGLTLLFPLRWLDVNGMQLSNVVHGFIGIVFVTGILAHIYIGTIGMEGAFEAMGSGTVDVCWARQHHDLWAQEVTHGTSSDTVEPPPSRPRVVRG